MKVIETYIDNCLQFAEENQEYLMYVPFGEEKVEPEMFNPIDINIFSNKPDRIFIIQKDRTDFFIHKGTAKDMFWKPVENNISEEEINNLEKQLNIIFPVPYKEYLKYKHYYEVFWDLNVVLYAKPQNAWKQILINKNQNTKEIILDKGYFAIGKYSDYGEIALKLGSEETDELEIVMFDYETGEVGEKLAENFTDFLEQILKIDKPNFRELKEFEKKMGIYK